MVNKGIMQEHLEATASKGTLLHSAIQGQGHNGLLNDSYNWVLGYPDYHVRKLVWSEDFDAPRSPASLATTGTLTPTSTTLHLLETNIH
jgi:hypothetical protein